MSGAPVTVLIIGDANADLSAALTHFPHEGDDAPVSSLSWTSGGAGANVAAALALQGESARLLARVGRDSAAEVALRAALRAGADLEHIQRDPDLATGLCFAAVSPGGERTFFSFRGANAALAAPDSDPLHGARWLHVCGHALLEGAQRQTTLALLDQAARRGVPASLDLCLPLLRAHHADTAALLGRLRVLFGNQAEFALLCPDLPPERALAELGARGLPLALLKRGAGGCWAAGPELWLEAPGLPVRAVDTNGCGDAFAAGFIAGVLRGQPLAESAALANALGALTATRRGAADALPDAAQVRALLAQC
jgi:sugar/nucleoside kinase (ribokinase family)